MSLATLKSFKLLKNNRKITSLYGFHQGIQALLTMPVNNDKRAMQIVRRRLQDFSTRQLPM